MKHIYIILLSILFFISACSFDEDVSSPVMPADFEFSLTYGTYGKQKVDTF
ncbi:hypothetical protein [Sutcliffiella horikoshii]|uniref:hypothetical protein n=1 Tax=Sutcliffiella horikoshii TaxID=79883 RepID=UPI001653CED1|nr:hypothetical protein [Sutcliffiella horikoshii]